MSSRRSNRVLGIALLVLGLVSEASPARSGALLAEAISPGHGVALSADALAGARALGEAIEALSAGDLARCDEALERASQSAVLPDYVAYYRAAWLLAKGDAKRVVDQLEAARDRAPVGRRLQSRLARLRGDALRLLGKEVEARAAWQVALDGTQDDSEREALKLAIVESRLRSGELQGDADSRTWVARVFPAEALSRDLSPGERSSQAALAAADALLASGRGADAIEAYREALAGGLDESTARRARMQEGLALFQLRRYEEAVGVFGGLGKEPEARFWLARSLARSGRVRRALEIFEKLGEEAPPDFASRALYLAGVLQQDRGEVERAMAHFERVVGFEAYPERVLDALWLIGWSAFLRGDFDAARTRFLEMTRRETDPLDALRPRYWAARAAALRERPGDVRLAREELAGIARAFPLSYYGWRARERLGLTLEAITPAIPAAPGERAVSLVSTASGDGSDSRPSLSEREVVRVACLLEAGLAEDARTELDALEDRVRTLSEHIRVGRLWMEAGDYYRAQRLVVSSYALPLSRGLEPGKERLWYLSWPPVYRDLIASALPEQTRVDPALVWAIMREESSFRPAVMSSAGAMGLLQLMPETARNTARRTGYREFDETELLAPETNIALGTAYLDRLTGLFPDRISAVIGSYNAGPRAVSGWLAGEAGELEDDVWVENIPYSQTRSYVKRVLRSLQVYRAFY